jgi:hypothetical protein
VRSLFGVRSVVRAGVHAASGGPVRRVAASAVVALIAGSATVVGVAPGTATAATAATWQPVSTPQPTSLSDHAFDDISCPTTSFCMAVGDSASADGDEVAPAVETFDGHDWTVRHPIGVGTESDLTGVSCLSATACTAVGASLDAKADRDDPLAESWNGQTWRIETTVVPAAGGALASVSCPTSSTCLAVGGTDGLRTLTERWRSGGAGWSVLAAPAPGGDAGLEHVSCVSTSFCVTVGQAGASGGSGVADTYNGTAWTGDTLPGGARGGLRGVSCPAAHACVAVGRVPGSVSSPVSLVLTGTTWTAHTVAIAGRSGELLGVACRSATSCTAVGDRSPTTSSQVPAVDHWNGSTWAARTVRAPATAVSSLGGVSSPGTATAYAVGADSAASGQGSKVLVQRGTPT